MHGGDLHAGLGGDPLSVLPGVLLESKQRRWNQWEAIPTIPGPWEPGHWEPGHWEPGPGSQALGSQALGSQAPGS